jgi:hypothetical protein
MPDANNMPVVADADPVTLLPVWGYEVGGLSNRTDDDVRAELELMFILAKQVEATVQLVTTHDDAERYGDDVPLQMQWLDAERGVVYVAIRRETNIVQIIPRDPATVTEWSKEPGSEGECWIDVREDFSVVFTRWYSS